MMLELFAQVGKKVVVNQPPNAGADAGAAAAGGIMAIIVLVLYGALILSGIIQLVFAIMTLIAQSKALSLCSSRNRLMEPSQVWLNFIPCFSIVWFIMTVLRVSESLMKEFRSRGLKHTGDFAKTSGIIVYVVSFFVNCVPFLAPIMFFLYWKKLSAINTQLEKAGKASRRSRDDDDDEEEEEEEERPRPKKRRPRDDDDE